MKFTMTPREVVEELDKHIIGQRDCKRSVAIALRNRWRRQQVEEGLRQEIVPKNILMIGPTGVGKTEVARRLAKMADAPFIKVEATKFTEVGYVGRDVESIIRDLADVSINQVRGRAMARVRHRAEDLAEERVLDILLRPARDADAKRDDSASRQLMRKKLRQGEMDEREIEVEVSASPQVGVEVMTPAGMEDMTQKLQDMFQGMGGQQVRNSRMPIREALQVLTDEEAGKLVNEDELRAEALANLEQNGMVFLDEIDKIAVRSEGRGQDVSREGVQRDLLPLIEGCTVSTKYGMVHTDHVLFIASGAFHLSKPADLIPELQGRLPIRVELQALTVNDFERILVEPDAALTTQYTAMMATEGLTLNFTKGGVGRIAEIAFEANERNENIGARRLHTVMERLLAEVAFEASDRSGEEVLVDEDYVGRQLGDLIEDQDLSRYVL